MKRAEDVNYNLTFIKKNKKLCQGIDPLQAIGLNQIKYAGWTIPYHGYTIERISLQDITPQDFFEQYISKRKPVIFKDSLPDKEFKASKNWTNEYLDQFCGDEEILVEKRESCMETFGKGKKVAMKFHDFLELMNQKNSLYYLTTQEVAIDGCLRPHIMSSFTKRLKKDFPIRPEIMGNLIPQNINVWMGHNEEGSSSGLHHDYHDNLYVLLRGKKRFRLYGPEEVKRMHTHGKFVCVHTNGRINYLDEETNACGVPLLKERQYIMKEYQENIENEIAEAEKDVLNNVAGAHKRLQKAEEKLEATMEEMLDLEDDISDNESFAESDASEDNPSIQNEKFFIEKEEVMKNSDPLSFSKIDLNDSCEKNEQLYPGFSKAKMAIAEISEGEMLYLPASWFHEVTSYGSSSFDGHLAINYWYHPPDKKDFSKPYTTSFWEKEWLEQENLL